MKKYILGLILLVLLVPFFSVDAYVSVKGHYRNGKWIAPYVRSNPNGLKYDNYSWTPSQGLYNKTYGTRGSEWDTPTYITDPNYYVGKSLYESGSYSPSTHTPSYTSYTSSYYSDSSNSENSVDVPANATLSSYSNTWYCDYGYQTKYDSSFNKIGCEKIKVPNNASLSYSGSTWYCDSGYTTKYDSNFNKVGCEEIIVPAHASLSSLGSTWYCDYGYETEYDNSFNKVGCSKIKVPKNAHLNSYGSDWYCDSGYTAKYDSQFNKVGCELD